MERNLLDIPLGDSTQHTTRSSHKYDSQLLQITHSTKKLETASSQQQLKNDILYIKTLSQANH